MFDAPSQTIEVAGVNRSETKYQVAETQSQRDAVAEKLKDKKIIALEVELEGDSTFDSKLLGVSFSWLPGEAAYIPIGSTQDPATVLASFKEILATIKLLKPVIILSM